jgi:hypothetical protein
MRAERQLQARELLQVPEHVWLTHVTRIEATQVWFGPDPRKDMPPWLALLGTVIVAALPVGCLYGSLGNPFVSPGVRLSTGLLAGLCLVLLVGFFAVNLVDLLRRRNPHEWRLDLEGQEVRIFGTDPDDPGEAVPLAAVELRIDELPRPHECPDSPS